MTITYTKNIIEVKKETFANTENVVSEIKWNIVGTDEFGNTGTYESSSMFHLESAFEHNKEIFDSLINPTETQLLNFLIITPNAQKQIDRNLTLQISEKTR